jgi:hypothetical protein
VEPPLGIIDPLWILVQGLDRSTYKLWDGPKKGPLGVRTQGLDAERRSKRELRRALGLVRVKSRSAVPGMAEVLAALDEDGDGDVTVLQPAA